MITIRRILCPTDFSEYSERALVHAIVLARRHEASITALHVIPAILPPFTVGLPPSRRGTRPAADRERALEEVRRYVGPVQSAGIPVEAVVVEGDVVVEILARAQALRADLLVLGTHGRSGFERWMLGSVAERLLRRASGPVLTVPRQASGRDEEAPQGFRRILCPVDFSETSLKALQHAFALAQESDARITLLHALEAAAEEEPPDLLRFDTDAYRRQLESDVREQLLDLVPRTARDWCEPEVLVVAGKAYREILAVAAEREADLIVMGVRGRAQVDPGFFGSTAQHVVRQAVCPVLTIRSG
jgi:nucleotide-binding universal stress UspA family protein